MFCLFSCDTTSQKKNDLQKENLKGKVKSVKTIRWKAIDKFGEITKGEIKWSWNSLTLYNDKGNLIEKNWYNPDGTLDSKWKYQYKYNQQGNWIERIRHENNIPKEITERTIEYITTKTKSNLKRLLFILYPNTYVFAQKTAILGFGGYIL